MKTITDRVKLIYCDYIANLIKDNLMLGDMHQLLDNIGVVQLDIGDRGQLQSTTKIINVQDKDGQMYQIVIMEVNND
jgi:hypothetical protein